ncbi:hypothetical protein LYZ86_03920 [Xanthomonas hortorum pv. cynarae]|nr:hypothetical protein [Xanthomonas hortorum pv. cynarae]
MKPEALTRNIARLYGMMTSLGYRAHRGKQEIQRAHNKMRATKLLVNRRAALTNPERQAIRAAVYLVERQASVGQGLLDVDFIKQLNTVAGRVARLKRLHITEGQALQLRLQELRSSIQKNDNNQRASDLTLKTMSYP